MNKWIMVRWAIRVGPFAGEVLRPVERFRLVVTWKLVTGSNRRERRDEARPLDSGPKICTYTADGE